MSGPFEILSILDVKAGYKSGSEIKYEDVPFANRFTMNANPSNITFEGDNAQDIVYIPSEPTGTVAHDKLSIALLQRIFGKALITGEELDYVAVTTGGTGYPQDTEVTFTGGAGSGAAAYPIVEAGVVTAIVVTDRGTGYTSAPTVVITGSGGSSAAATAHLTTLPTGAEEVIYFGDNSELASPYFMWVVTLAAIDMADHSDKYIVYTVYKVTAGPYTPADSTNRAKTTDQITWTSHRTAKDILDNALSGCPTEGCYFSMAVTATAPA